MKIKTIKYNKLLVTYDLDTTKKSYDKNKLKLEKFLRDEKKKHFKEWIHLQGSTWCFQTKLTAKTLYKHFVENYLKHKFSVSNISKHGIYHNGRLEDKKDEKNASDNGDKIFPKAILQSPNH